MDWFLKAQGLWQPFKPVSAILYGRTQWGKHPMDKPKTSRLAIGAFVCGLISASSFYIAKFFADSYYKNQWGFSEDVKHFIFGFIPWGAPPLFCIASILLCIMALASIKQSNGRLKGKGLAIWGPAISIAQIILFILRLPYGPWGGP